MVQRQTLEFVEAHRPIHDSDAKVCPTFLAIEIPLITPKRAFPSRETSSEIDREERSTQSLQKPPLRTSEILLADDIEMNQLRELRGSNKRGF